MKGNVYLKAFKCHSKMNMYSWQYFLFFFFLTCYPLYRLVYVSLYGRNNVLMLLLLLPSHFSRVWLCVIPQTAPHQTPPSLGSCRQELWSGLPFPSPMHESEKWKWSQSAMSDSQRPHGPQPTTSMGFSRQEHWSGVPLPSPLHY